MSIFEITLAVILTLLGLAILAILLARWTRRKQNETYMSRYSSEQSTGLLDSEDDKDYSSRRSKRGRGFRHSYSTESDISYGDQGSKGYCTPSNNSLALSQSNVALPQGSVSHTKCIRAAQEPLSGAVGPISGTIGPIMQFTAPVPGATGPIKLTQKTIDSRIQRFHRVIIPPTTPLGWTHPGSAIKIVKLKYKVKKLDSPRFCHKNCEAEIQSEKITFRDDPA
ncbi:testis-expressed basic protein 1 isoform X38 [Oryctolagus cuniculus]|uniref:testis-expressed basic protein 1 isoform X38 n=1 Tax=Oryctolagus cuniculus TaxID=9986 RepID=UPI00387A05FA